MLKTLVAEIGYIDYVKTLDERKKDAATDGEEGEEAEGAVEAIELIRQLTELLDQSVAVAADAEEEEEVRLRSVEKHIATMQGSSTRNMPKFGTS